MLKELIFPSCKTKSHFSVPSFDEADGNKKVCNNTCWQRRCWSCCCTKRWLFTSVIVTVSCWMWPWFIDVKDCFKALSNLNTGGALRGQRQELRTGKIIHCIWPAKCSSQVNILINNLELCWLNSTFLLSCGSLQRHRMECKHLHTTN